MRIKCHQMLTLVLALSVSGLTPTIAVAKPTPKLELQASEPDRLNLSERPTHFERIRKKRKWNLFTAGAILFLGAYAGNIAMTYGFTHQPATNSLIPLAGPLIQYTDHFGLDGPPVNTGSADADRKIMSTINLANTAIMYVDYALLGVDAFFQFIGATLMIVGVATKNTIVTYERAKESKQAWDWDLQPTNNGATFILRY